jgi:serine protease Do
MRLSLFVACIIGFLAAVTFRSEAEPYADLFYDFRSDQLSWEDKRFLQAALAFEGHYNGLLDGDWGRISQRALERYSRQEFGTNAQDWHMAMLAFSLIERFDSDGWELRYFDQIGMSLLFPNKTAVPDRPSEFFRNWRHANSSLSYSFAVTDVAEANRFHDYVLSKHGRSEPPYTVRKEGFAVTSAQALDGSTVYARSNFVRGRWSTVIISAQERDKAELNAVAASMTVGSTHPMFFTEGGNLQLAVQRVIDLATSEEDAQTASNQSMERSNNPPENGGSSGSGFFVSYDGHILTNAHVVEGCTNLTANGQPAKLINVSNAFDLAILKTGFDPDSTIAVFSPRSARLNSDVTVSGYPYAGLLGGLNITRGAVSALTGLGGDETTLQITAPVQSGNSGGPVIAADGEVIGVVVAKLDAMKVAGALGDVPQNVNFAVRGEIAKMYLSQHGVDPQLGTSDDPVEPTELAERSARFTVFVECR